MLLTSLPPPPLFSLWRLQPDWILKDWSNIEVIVSLEDGPHLSVCAAMSLWPTPVHLDRKKNKNSVSYTDRDFYPVSFYQELQNCLIYRLYWNLLTYLSAAWYSDHLHAGTLLTFHLQCIIEAPEIIYSHYMGHQVAFFDDQNFVVSLQFCSSEKVKHYTSRGCCAWVKPMLRHMSTVKSINFWLLNDLEPLCSADVPPQAHISRLIEWNSWTWCRIYRYCMLRGTIFTFFLLLSGLNNMRI